MNTLMISKLSQLSVNQIDELISKLEEGYDFLLHELIDIKKCYKLNDIIGILIDLRCEKMGINI